MKRITQTTLLLAGISLAAPAHVIGQGAPSTPPPSERPKQTQVDQREMEPKHAKKSDHLASGTAATSGAAAGIRRVSKDSIEDRKTAKHLIGKAVHGSDGKKLGDITDLMLGDAMGVGYAGRGHTEADRTAANPTLADGRGTATSSAGTSGSTSSGARGTSQPSQPGGQEGHSGAWSAGKEMYAGSKGGIQAIISVGGVLGVGDNLVAVPFSDLVYDSGAERYTLNINQTEFNRIAGKN